LTEKEDRKRLSDDELLELNAEDVQSRDLTEEEIERWNNLKSDTHRKNIEEKKTEDASKSLDALEEMKKSVEEELTTTVEVKGVEVEVLVDPDEKVWSKLQTIREFKDKKPEEIPEEKIRELKETAFEFLGLATVDYSVEDWKEIYSDSGLETLSFLCNSIYKPVKEEREKKRQRSRR